MPESALWRWPVAPLDRRSGGDGVTPCPSHDSRVPAVGRRVAAAVHRYRVEPLAPDAPFGACHCIDLPLLFGDADAWRDAPMLGGLPFDRVDALGAPMRRVWGEFVCSGNADPLRWQPHTVGSRTVFPFP